MNDRQLKSFISVAESGSFSKSAKQNYISVPAIIGQIDLLEEETGIELFIRTNHGIQLTTGGEIFLDAARKMLTIGTSAIQAAKSSSVKELSIGVASDQMPDFLMSACEHYAKFNAETTFRFVHCPYNEQLDSVRHYLFDTCIIAEPDVKYLGGLHYEVLSEERYSFAMKSDHPLASKSLIHLSDLSGVSVLCGSYPYLRKSFAEGLKNSAAIFKPINTEYSFQDQANALFSDELIVFHSMWSKAYASILKVIPSDIPAGTIGVVCRKSNIGPVTPFMNYLKDSLFNF